MKYEPKPTKDSRDKRLAFYQTRIREIQADRKKKEQKERKQG